MKNVEGLLIAEELRKIALPSKRLAWRFLDAYTFVLPLNEGAIWMFNRPPNSRLAFEEETPNQTKTYSGFQDLLVSRANGDLLAVEQLKLDRVLFLKFGAGKGFVPTPPVTLVVELTGRNCNLILLDEQYKILGAARDISEETNRFRQVRVGLPYHPPPPYEKLDPRLATDEDITKALLGKTLSKVRTLLDGIGPDLTRALIITSGVSGDKKLGPPDMPMVISALRSLVASPSTIMREALAMPNLEELRKREERQTTLEQLRLGLDKEIKLFEARLEDIKKAREAALEADRFRAQADVLMAYQFQVPKNAEQVTLTGFDGSEVKIQLDPKLSALENAKSLYERAKKREVRKVQAESRESELKEKLLGLVRLKEGLESFADDELAELLKIYAPVEKQQVRTEPGIRYTAPHGFSVIVGRNAKENDIVTFKLAKSRDVWLHAQGYPGSHVIIQSENREVPFETILFAAQLAAAYSKAGQSDNVPVDYALRKNVWKPKGAAPGAVYITQQKTVYVTPSRRPEIVAG
jgi:predicted ribosome quality control (RQC) complex YloA/Tae2 family protein